MVSTSMSSETETVNGRSFVASLYRVMHKGWTFRYRRRQSRHKSEWSMSAADTMKICFGTKRKSQKGRLPPVSEGHTRPPSSPQESVKSRLSRGKHRSNSFGHSRAARSGWEETCEAALSVQDVSEGRVIDRVLIGSAHRHLFEIDLVGRRDLLRLRLAATEGSKSWVEGFRVAPNQLWFIARRIERDEHRLYFRPQRP